MDDRSPETLFESIEKHIKEMEALVPTTEDSSIHKDELCTNLLELCDRYI